MNAEPPPNNNYRCEARETGKASFEFATPDGEAARAMCDAHGWEMIRIYQPGTDADRPAEAVEKGNPPLTKRQLQALAIESGAAYRLLKDSDLVDDLSEHDWRHHQVQSLVKRDGLKLCQNSQYLKLLRHFKKLQGKPAMEPSSGGKQSAEGGDTLDRRSQLLALISNDLGHHFRRVQKPQDAHECRISEEANKKGGPITPAYLLTTARAKNPGCTIIDEGALITLTAAKLEQLLFTVRNRIAAREGRGDAKKRNRKQKGADS